MPGPVCALRVLKPTSTTVSFTVSTRAPVETRTARVIHVSLLILRFLLVCQVLLTLWTEWQLHALKEHGRDVPPWLRESGPGRAAAWATQALTARYLVPVSLLGLWILVRRGYTEESLFVLRGLGIETTSSSSTYLSTASTRFIPTTAIQDIFIYEAFKGFEVRFYLAIVVEGEEDVVVVFPNLLPGLAILEEVWRETRTCLYQPKS